MRKTPIKNGEERSAEIAAYTAKKLEAKIKAEAIRRERQEQQREREAAKTLGGGRPPELPPAPPRAIHEPHGQSVNQAAGQVPQDRRDAHRSAALRPDWLRNMNGDPQPPAPNPNLPRTTYVPAGGQQHRGGGYEYEEQEQHPQHQQHHHQHHHQQQQHLHSNPHVEQRVGGQQQYGRGGGQAPQYGHGGGGLGVRVQESQGPGVGWNHWSEEGRTPERPTTQESRLQEEEELRKMEEELREFRRQRRGGAPAGGPGGGGRPPLDALGGMPEEGRGGG